MKVVGLDLSTSSGICYFKDGKLIAHDKVVCKVIGNEKSSNYPLNYLEMAETVAWELMKVILEVCPDYVVIEETNKGKNRYFQKQLEYIHFAIASSLRDWNPQTAPKVRYIDTSAWRKILSISMDKNQRIQNKSRKQERDEIKEEISKSIYNRLHSKIQKEIEGLNKRESNKVIKKWDREINKLVGQEMKKRRSSIKGIDTKTLSINYVNEHFSLDFKRKDNDIADAICVAYAFIKNNYSSLVEKK